MSYDLLVFDPATVPLANRAAFIEWYEEATSWAGSHDYNDPASTSQPLQNWYGDMRLKYPPMNGPYAKNFGPLQFSMNAKVTDYSIAPDAIYASFSWSQAFGAYRTVTRLAGKHEVGFFDVSSENGGVWVPDGKGGMRQIF